ncbi:pre-mRNA cleavage complex 2 protein Pcf11 [Trichonephila inaurata madagascariensis]|uniref:Pre-mRNA cleavage complex 2 protein Pcf11 n=1 Tax=Trichonephila inaurata madagascariensis TaxID=2747483 RepID=A0A8X6IWU4_9ARAC|nr:pre-mRNA cleavage complex 2 protein Pcf11 [Trichonephila inaurata madagascariensis]
MIIIFLLQVQAELKLPSLYLVDSIMKNIGGQYIILFSKHMVSLFTSVFAKVDEATRSALYKLRQTWNDLLFKNVLYEIDCKVNSIDPAWPITAKPTVNMNVTPAKNTIHVNPKFVGGNAPQASNPPRNPAKVSATKKNEISLKEKEELLEMKMKQDQMLKLIEEKRTHLKALEQKKLEMAAQQKKKGTANANAGAFIESLQNTEKKTLNHRDPRLKKNVFIAQPPSESAKAHLLQSVVVVPKVPSDFTSNQIGNEGSKPVQKNIKTEPQCGSVPNEILYSSDKIDQSFKTLIKLNVLKDFLKKIMVKNMFQTKTGILSFRIRNIL